MEKKDNDKCECGGCEIPIGMPIAIGRTCSANQITRMIDNWTERGTKAD